MPRIADTGSIVNVSSIAGAGWPLRLDLLKELLALEGFDEAEAWLEANAPADVPHYNFSKEIVTTYTILSAMKRLPGGPRINAVCPGVIETPLLPDFRASMGAELIDHVATMTGRHATPNDVAEVVLFLLSDASRWIKGRALTVDGGTMTAADLGFAVAPETAAA